MEVSEREMAPQAGNARSFKKSSWGGPIPKLPTVAFLSGGDSPELRPNKRQAMGLVWSWDPSRFTLAEGVADAICQPK